MMEEGTRTMFSHGLELGNSVVASGVLRQSGTAIYDLYNQNGTRSSSPLRYKVYKDKSNYTILAFVATNNNIQGREGLVSYQTLKDRDFHVFDFLSTKGNPSFSINEAALSLFEFLHDNGHLFLENEITGSSPLIITGHSLGGSVAALFTLWLLETTEQRKRKEAEEKKRNGNVEEETPPPPNKRTLCITFGSPLIGDDGLRKAVEEQIWSSCFLHVASNQDPIPRLLISSERGYMPFGIFLFCSSIGLACFEDPDLILGLLAAMGSESVSSQGLEVFSYENLVNYLEDRMKCNGNLVSVESTWDQLRAAIVIQLEGIGIKRTQSEVIDTIITKMKDDNDRWKNVPDEAKRLNDIKMNMVHLEWYMKKSKDKGLGYYDCYKRASSKPDVEVKKYLKLLTDYWIETVTDADKKPQKVQASLRTRWLYSGTNYRRMVEPLDIANHYKGNAPNEYLTHGRSQHYVMLEKWYNEQGKPKNEKKGTKACSMTEDSLFWANVENAIISFNSLKNGVVSQENKEPLRKKLIEFERYVMNLKDDYKVSTEIFLKQSTFMQWWNEYEKEYEKIIGSFNTSPLAPFMKSGNYVLYA